MRSSKVDKRIITKGFGSQVIGLSTGEVEVHTISQKFSALMPEEVDQFSQLLSNTM